MIWCPNHISCSHTGLCMATMAHPDWPALFGIHLYWSFPMVLWQELLADLWTNRSWHTFDQVCPAAWSIWRLRLLCGTTKHSWRQRVQIHCKNSSCILGIMLSPFPVLLFLLLHAWTRAHVTHTPLPHSKHLFCNHFTCLEIYDSHRNSVACNS